MTAIENFDARQFRLLRNVVVHEISVASMALVRRNGAQRTPQAQVDGGRVEGVHRRIQLDAQRLVRIQGPGYADEMRPKVCCQTLKSRPDTNTEFGKQIINLRSPDVKTLGHY